MRANWQIGTSPNPGIRRLRVSALLEPLDEVAKPTTQHTPRTRTAEKSARVAGHAALRSLVVLLAGCTARLLPPAQHFGDLVPVLITRNSEQSQKCNHRGHSAAHFILLLILVEGHRPVRRLPIGAPGAAGDCPVYPHRLAGPDER